MMQIMGIKKSESSLIVVEWGGIHESYLSHMGKSGSLQ